MRGRTVAAAVGSVVAIGLVVAVVVLVVDERQQRDNIDELEAQLATVRRAAETGGRDIDAAKQQLQQAQEQLQQVQKDLETAKGTVAQQSGDIVVLKSCLAGVSQFFDKAAAGDQQGAVSALNAVQAQCDAADKLLSQ